MAVGQRALATLGGLVAIVLWSATMGFSRLLTEPLGAMTAGAGIYTTAGVLGCLWFYRSPAGRRQFVRLPLRYLIGCGGMFVLYTVLLYSFIGLASGRRQLLEVGVINYLWPGLTLLFAIPLLGRRPRWLFPVGALMAFAGVLVATCPDGGWDANAFGRNLQTNGLPYALALIAAVLWALYSNFVRRWAGATPGAGIPIFILASGIAMFIARTAFGESPQWSPRSVAIMGFMAAGPALVGYVLWDIAMRRGNMTFVASCAYLIPILSTLVSCLVLGVLPSVTLWIGCALVVVGAVVARAHLR